MYLPGVAMEEQTSEGTVEENGGTLGLGRGRPLSSVVSLRPPLSLVATPLIGLPEPEQLEGPEEPAFCKAGREQAGIMGDAR